MVAFASLLQSESSAMLAISLRRMLWNMPPLYAIGGTLVLITIVGLWAASRW